ncbi:MAG TPA: MFS transporter [Terriglobia bacterium]|nr:MFS transporter [Terriglobia bacterium]
MKLSFRTKLTLVIVLAFATILNYLDRQALSILAPTLQREMSIDNAHLGWLFAIFYYSYTLLQFAVGPVLDRFNLRWCFAVAVLAWSVVSGMTGLATGFISLLVFRFFLGVTEAPNWPAGLRTIARTLPPEERTLGSGIFESGAAVGAVLAPAAIFALLGRFGWRSAFFCLGSLGFFWAPIWLYVTRGRNLAQVWIGARSETHGIGTLVSIYREFIHSRQFWWVLVVSVTVNPCFYFTVNWLPTYFVQARGLVPGVQLGEMLTVIYLSLDIGNIGGGAGTLLLARYFSVGTARRVVFMMATALVGLCAIVPFIARPWGAVAALVAVNMGLGTWSSMYLTMAQEVSSTHVSTAAGTLSGFGSLVGALAMWAVGNVTESIGGFTIPMVAVTVAIALAAVAGWAATQQLAIPPSTPLTSQEA